MMSWRECLSRLLGSLHVGRSDHELEEELRFHLDATTAAAQRRSVDGGNERRPARAQTGSLSQSLDALRDQRGLPWLDDAKRDLRQALRIFARAPGFTAVALLTLGLGIGASTVMFSVLNAVVLRPLPYRESRGLVLLWTDDVKRQLHRTLVPNPLYVEWKARARSFTDLGFSSPNTPMTLSGFPEAERLDAARVSASTFDLLGVPLSAGRPFSADEERKDEPVVVVSRSLAERRFGDAQSALGRVLVLDGEPTNIIGVMSESFGFPTSDVQLWRPLGKRLGRMIVIGRLRSGIGLGQAREEMAGMGGS